MKIQGSHGQVVSRNVARNAMDMDWTVWARTPEERQFALANADNLVMAD